MGGWRLARALEVLRDEIWQVAPGTTVWTIGDQRHQSGWSDHNPNAAGVVCAVDVLGDAGLDLAWLAETVRTSGHPALDYVIYQDRIASAGQPWRDYGGDYHHHVHVSVGDGPDGRATGGYDDISPWGLTGGQGGGTGATTGGITDMLGLRKGDIDQPDEPPRVELLQVMLDQSGHDPGPHDGIYGDQTSGALLRLRRSIGSKATSGDVVSPDAWEQLMRVHAMRFAAGKPGPAGPPGPPGEPGPAGVVDLDAVTAAIVRLVQAAATAAKG